MLGEVVATGPLLREGVAEVLLIDFTRPYGRRMPRFTKDYLDMVSPKVQYHPDFDGMARRLVAAFAPEGARLSDNGLEVMLPNQLWDELRSAARAHGYGVGE